MTGRVQEAPAPGEAQLTAEFIDFDRERDTRGMAIGVLDAAPDNRSGSRQPVDDAARAARCEQMAFNPWHARPEHRPLAGMYRARKRLAAH
jgi:hypothetical protein